MFSEETAKVHIDLQGNILHPIHWGTFNLALYPWNEPMQRFTRAADSLSIVRSTPVAGGTTVFDSQLATEKWWENLAEAGVKETDSLSVLEIQAAQ